MEKCLDNQRELLHHLYQDGASAEVDEDGSPRPRTSLQPPNGGPLGGKRTSFSMPDESTMQKYVKEIVETNLEVQVNHLFQDLQDGVFLCQLLEKCKQCPKFNANPKSNHQCLVNVSQFLEKFQQLDASEATKATLFDPSDLVEHKNDRKVLLSLFRTFKHLEGHGLAAPRVVECELVIDAVTVDDQSEGGSPAAGSSPSKQTLQGSSPSAGDLDNSIGAESFTSLTIPVANIQEEPQAVGAGDDDGRCACSAEAAKGEAPSTPMECAPIPAGQTEGYDDRRDACSAEAVKGEAFSTPVECDTPITAEQTEGDDNGRGAHSAEAAKGDAPSTPMECTPPIPAEKTEGPIVAARPSFRVICTVFSYVLLFVIASCVVIAGFVYGLGLTELCQTAEVGLDTCPSEAVVEGRLLYFQQLSNSVMAMGCDLRRHLLNAVQIP
eukprot:GGOE01020874.1.p1 GENE.GGOE01020874.1~~GGOE01020874.1.p1  ORF type:complete len:448 (-),score=79.96 GGOE01020874.1:655-1968(-)